MHPTPECYAFERLQYKSGFLDGCIDATYIIHLEGNGRLSHIHAQLRTFHPSATVYISFNRGFKKCEKNLPLSIPPHDLIHAFRSVFTHANQNGYNNILVLEDDFIFDASILEREHTDSICDFINCRSNEAFMYSLGCVPYLQVPVRWRHRIVVAKGGTHACIYTRSLREKLLRVGIEQISDWDNYTNSHVKQFMYFFPLCYQLFPTTENSKHWKYFPIFSDIKRAVMGVLEMDKTPIPGFQYYYTFSLVLFSILVVVCFAVPYIILKSTYGAPKRPKGPKGPKGPKRLGGKICNSRFLLPHYHLFDR